MLPERTDSERRAAIELMYRIRAVESPPDELGQRTIWHRGSKGAELVSWVDADGRVFRQELMLFEDVLVWERGVGFKSGEVLMAGGNRVLKPSDAVSFDSSLKVERVARAARGLSEYSGADRFIEHIRELLKPPDPGSLAFEEQITRPSHVVLQDLEAEGKATPVEPVDQSTRQWVALGLVVGVLVFVALALAWYLSFSRH